MKQLLLVLLVTQCLGGQIEVKIYEDIKGFQQCILLTNATHQVGCTSDMKGNKGVLHFIDNDADLDWLINKGPHEPYIPLLNSSMFTRETMDKLMASKKVNGVLMIHLASTNLPTAGFSPDVECPMDKFGSYYKDPKYKSCQKVKWNPVGNGMSFVYYGIPIFALTSKDEIEKLIKCYKKHNDHTLLDKIDYPLCAVELKNFMFAAKDTPTCMRKTETANPIGSTYCDPLEDKNVHGFMEPLVGKVEDNDIIMAATRLDSTAFFHDIALSADNGVTGIVTLLLAAHALGDYKRNMLAQNKTEKLKPILFSFFNGEIFDYIGSSKMVFDMEKGSFPYSADNPFAAFDAKNITDITDDMYLSKFNLSKIGYFLEVGQVGIGSDVFVHTDPGKDEKVQKDLMDLIESSGTAAGLSPKIVSTDQPLPPASFQRFLRKRKNIPGAVFTDHEKQFTNLYYNSRFDNTLNLNISWETEKKMNSNESYMKLKGPLLDKINKLGIVLANTLYKLASNGTEPQENITVPKEVTANLLYCFLYSANCPSFKEIYNEKETKPFANTSIARYISVGQINNVITQVVRRLLAYYTGEWIQGPCAHIQNKLPQAFSYMTLKGQFINKTYTCVKSVSFLTPAVSPAFELKDYASEEYSTWTESMWSGDVGVRLFLIANPTYEIVILVVGIVLLLASFIFVYFVKKNANVLFTPSIVVING